jgi:hypothetical protein
MSTLTTEESLAKLLQTAITTLNAHRRTRCRSCGAIPGCCPREQLARNTLDLLVDDPQLARQMPALECPTPESAP